MNVNKGELAWIHYPSHSSHGVFVVVHEFIPPGTVVLLANSELMARDPAWWVESKTGVRLEITFCEAHVLHRFPVSDRYLRPIRGGPLDEVTSDGREIAF